MYFHPRPVAGFMAEHAEFLGVDLAVGTITARNQVLAVGMAYDRHLLLDPDTGLWAGQNRPNRGWNGYVSMDELAQIANAQGREHKLTLVFDQSYSNATYEERKQLAEGKLQTLREDHEVYGVAYVSHVAFIWVSKDADLLARATQQLLQRSRLPLSRFVDDGCGHHIGA